MIELDGVQPNFPAKLRKNRTFQDFIDGITLTAIAALLVVVIMLYITTISFSAEFSLKQIGIEGVILYAVTVSISLLARKYSRRKGKATQSYIKAITRVDENNHKIISGGYSPRTAEYCRRWEEAELCAERTKVLAAVGITVDDFVNKYLKYNKRELAAKYPDLTEDEVKTILAAKRIKRLKYDEKYLTTSAETGGRHSPSGGFNARTADKINIIQMFITGALSCLFSATLIIEVVANPSWGTIVTCAVKIIMIVIFGVFNIIGGYNLSAVREARELDEKADEQERFMRYCDSTAAPKKEEATTENMVAAALSPTEIGV